jgi:hypothetical protein
MSDLLNVISLAVFFLAFRLCSPAPPFSGLGICVIGKCLVSIIIPNFNKARYLSRAIASACSQTLQDIEIIVADDCSTDRSLSVIERFADSDRRVSYFVNRVSLFTNSNRIKAVSRARGEFILMLDSDDELINQTAEVDYHVALSTGADIVEHKAFVVSSGVRSPFTVQLAPFQVADRKQLMAAFEAMKMNWTLWRKLIRRVMYL